MKLYKLKQRSRKVQEVLEVSETHLTESYSFGLLLSLLHSGSPFSGVSQSWKSRNPVSQYQFEREFAKWKVTPEATGPFLNPYGENSTNAFL